MVGYLLRGIVVGIIFGVPAGALGALVIQRTLEHGYLAGLTTGLGSSVSDTIYASLCVLGSGFVSGPLKHYDLPVTLIGGVVILVLGIMTLRKRGIRQSDETGNLLADFSTGFGIGIMNPGMILLFLFACSVTKTAGPYTAAQSTFLLIGTFIGTLIWWLVLCTLMNALRRKITDRVYTTLNRVLGTLLVLFGIGVMIKAIL